MDKIEGQRHYLLALQWISSFTVVFEKSCYDQELFKASSESLSKVGFQ